SMEDLPALVAEHVAFVGFSQTMLYLADLQQQFLVPLPGQRDEAGNPLERIRIDATMAGRAFRNVEVVQARPDAEPAEPYAGEGPRRLWVPLLVGTERVGVPGVTVPEVDETTLTRASRLAALISLLVVSKRAFSDSYTLVVRARP